MSSPPSREPRGVPIPASRLSSLNSINRNAKLSPCHSTLSQRLLQASLPMPPPTSQNTTATPVPTHASPPPPPPNKWGPYASAKDFDASMATVLLVLVCATVTAFALHAALRFLLRRLRSFRPPRLPSSAAPEDGTAKTLAEAPPVAQLPGAVVFSAGATRVAGAPECAICLAELAEGDRVRVLPVCSHGFHAMCVEAWLAGRSSCPTCRTDCLPPPPPEAVTAEP